MGKRRLKPDDVVAMRDLRRVRYVSVCELADHFGVSPSTTWRALTGKTHSELNRRSAPVGRLMQTRPRNARTGRFS